MRLSQLVGRTVRDTPKDAELPSHRYMLRSGMMRQYTAGVYGFLPLGWRAVAKIEQIIREEMNAVEGQEISMSCMAPAELWKESGRYSAIGKEMFRFEDRNSKPMVLNMTHEEPVVYLARTELTSYKQLPAMMYQIQNKYRDEPRPRGGIIRSREFIMKDGYSFHVSEEDLQKYYDRVHVAYEKIFKRCGLKKVVSVQSDNGMFGGSFSHEFQLLVPTGEDKLMICSSSSCDYRANFEVAVTKHKVTQNPSTQLEKIHTPGMKTIADLVKGIGIKTEDTAKAVIFQTAEAVPVFVFVRGDLEVVEAKLRTLMGFAVYPAKDAVIAVAGGVPGSTGPKGLKLDQCWVVVDSSVQGAQGVVTGANEADYHWKGFEIERDFLATLSPEQSKRVRKGEVTAARTGDPCPTCGSAMQESRGIEIGNIFHLGTKYSKSMNCTFLDNNGKAQNHVMGCYGIGVTRLLPSVIEESHDDFGVIFPITVAPFQLHMCVINYKEEAVKAKAEQLYKEFQAAGVEVLFDDRDAKAGSQFADADLMGMPFRITLSPKTLEQGSVEFKYRDGREPMNMVLLEGLVQEVTKRVGAERSKF